MLNALVEGGLLRRDEATQRFRLGHFVLTWGILSEPTLRLREVCRPHVEELASLTGDSAYVIARSGAHGVCIDRAEGAYPIKALTLDIGAHRTLGVGAGGLAILSQLPAEERARVYAQGASDLRKYATTAAALEQLVSKTQSAGYAVSPGVVVPGITGVAVALRLPGGASAALSLVAINDRLTPSRIADGVRLLKARAARIEGELATKLQ